MVNGFVFQRIGRKYLTHWIPISLVISVSILLLVLGLGVVLFAHRRSKRGKPGGQAIRSCLQYSIIYWLALLDLANDFVLDFNDYRFRYISVSTSYGFTDR